MSLLDWLKPWKLASPRRLVGADPSAKLIRDLLAMRTPMSLATLKAASDAAAHGTAKSDMSAPRVPPVSRCSIAGAVIGVTLAV